MKSIAGAALAMSMFSALPAFSREAIENESVRVTVDDDGSFSVSALPSGRNVLTNGKLSMAGAAKKSAVNDKAFGQGQQIEITGAKGAGARVMVFSKLPFVLVRVTLANTGAEEQVLNKVPIATFNVDLGKPASELKTMGTGGLSDATKPEGSYVWLAVAEPKTRNGVVAAWLTHDRASGVLMPKAAGANVVVEARGDYGRLRILPGKTAESETLALGCFDDARVGLEQWANAVAKQYAIKLPPQPVGYCTWYAEKHGGSADEKSLAELTDFAAKHLKDFGFDFVQIDDHWQLGTRMGSSPKKNFSAADPKGPYPSGMKATADHIKSRGMTPGIWFIPFAGTLTDPWFADKQDLFVHDTTGRVYDSTWGGHPLDMTNPKAQAYLREIVGRIAHEWGYTYFKMDGLYTGLAVRQNYVNDKYKEETYKPDKDKPAEPASFGDAVFFNPDKTNVEAYRDGMKLIRDAAGKDVFFLGCNMAQNMRMFGASFGLFDAMRVGPDNKGNWASWVRSPVAGSREYFLNGRIWYNDPDPQYVRAGTSKDTVEEPNAAAKGTNAAGLTTEEAKTIASWHTISGGLNTMSDWLPDLPAERLSILRRTMPSHGKTARPVDYFENDPPRVWVVNDEKSSARRDVIALFNWSDQEQSFDLPLSRFGLAEGGEYLGFDYWGNRFVTLQGSVKIKLPKHGCQVLAARARADHPQLISTSRHITQGMIDVSEEKWDAATRTLSGRSVVVAGDPYELRIALPAGANVRASGARLGNGESEADVKLAQEADGVRATITSKRSQTVNWSVSF